MSYRTASAEKFTMIDDLFDLDNVDGQNFGNGPDDRNYNNYLRDHNKIPHSHSGMGGGPVQQYEPQMEQQYDEPPPPLRQHVQIGQQTGQRYEPSQYEPQMEQQLNEPIRSYTMPHNTPTCLEIADHVANCPICSKFYNNDPTIYIIAILILSAVCIVLLKKVLDSK